MDRKPPVPEEPDEEGVEIDLGDNEELQHEESR